jgi:hypothetical protein
MWFTIQCVPQVSTNIYIIVSNSFIFRGKITVRFNSRRVESPFLKSMSPPRSTTTFQDDGFGVVDLASQRLRSLTVFLFYYRGRISRTKLKHPEEHEERKIGDLNFISQGMMWSALGDGASTIMDICSFNMSVTHTHLCNHVLHLRSKQSTNATLLLPLQKELM